MGNSVLLASHHKIFTFYFWKFWNVQETFVYMHLRKIKKKQVKKIINFCLNLTHRERR